MRLLHINASPRKENSRTLEISTEFLNSLQEKVSDLSVKTINVFEENLPAINGLEANTKMLLMGGVAIDEQAQKAWESIDAYSRDFVSHDGYLITAPMWNFGLPYQLKHYIDVIVQAGILFHYTANGPEGLVKGKKMYVITSRGGDYSQDSPMNQFDFMENYLKSIFGFVGIYDVSFIHAQPLDLGPELKEQGMNKAKESARELALSV
ncbi:MAG: NAD(P)H-dependent oxidoreductase [Bacteroidota bacterium]